MAKQVKKNTDKSNPTLFSLKGTIYGVHNEILPGVLVKAFDRDLRTEQLLGEAFTDVTGHYTIKFNSLKSSGAEIKYPDVLIRVFQKTTRSQKELGSSEIHFNVPPEFTLDFKVDGSSYLGPSEFEHLVHTIEPLLKDQQVDFADLVENDKHKDISFLSAETGEDSGKIAFIPLAFQHAKAAKLPPDLFYGLFRMQYPTSLNSLTLVKSESLARGINKAIEQHIISSKWKTKIPEFIKKMNHLSTDIILKGKAEDHFAEKQKNQDDFTKIITITLPNKKLQKTFIDTYLASEAEPGKFWEKLALHDDFKDGKAIKETQNILRLNLMTAQPQLTARLYKLQEQDPELKEFSGYAKLTKKDFAGHISSLVSSGEIKEFPEGIEGKNPDEKIDHYAATLENLMTELFPVEAFKNHLARDNNHPFGPSKADLMSFLSKNPDFDLKTSKINKAMEDSDFNGIDHPDAIKKEIKTINRIYKLTPNYNHTSFLLNNKLDSATAIVQKLSKKQFLQKTDDKIDQNRATQIYKTAVQIDKYSTAIATDLKMRNDISVYAIQGKTKVSPDYQSLFGDNYLCECEHCQSVYSPSAYLTDILHLISKKHPAAYTSLTESRRPDIPDILLTCKNTNTPLPYIDLVNELLEGFLSPEGIVGLQTTNTAAELAAYPEHVNHEVYENKLSSSFDSFHLPLNLPLEETRLYLEKLGCKRYELMELFFGKKGNDIYQDLIIAAEYLQLSKQELDFINKTIPAEPINHEKVDAFLVDTGLTYEELLQLLECYYINPLKSDKSRTIEIVADEMDEDGHPIDPATCNIAYLKLQGITLETSEKIIRFIRLWKKLKWEVFDLDRVFMALGVDMTSASSIDINDKIVIPLSHTVRLQKLFGLDINSILSFWSSMDTATYRVQSQNEEFVLPSQYEKLFQNKKISNPSDPDFTDPTNLSGSLTQKSSLITAALGLAESDYNLLLHSVLLNDDLTLENLSILYRHSLLARKMKMTIQSLLLFIELTGTNPFGQPDSTSGTLNFIDRVRLIKSYGFSYAELNRYLKGISTNLTSPDPNLTIAQLTTLREGLSKLEPLFPGAEAIPDIKENKRRAQIDFLSDALSPALNLPSEIIDIMLDGMVTFKKASNDFEEVGIILTDPTFIKGEEAITFPDAGNLPDTFTAYHALRDTSERLEALLDKLSISPEEFVYFQQHQTALALEGIWNIPESGAGSEMFNTLKNLLYLLKFRDNLDHSSEHWFTLLDFPIFNEADAKSNFIDGFSELFEKSKDDLAFLLDTANPDSLNLTFPNDFLSGQNLLNLLNCLNKIKEWGSSSQVLTQLTKQDIKNEETQLAQGILKAKYDESGWLETIKPISNVLRRMKRDALVSYLLSSEETTDFRSDHDIVNTNGLFEYFLIDTEMSSCMVTSRIKQAISSIQLFVDRCFLGLEDGVDLGTEFFHQWSEWRKIYRVWEANRKVFLYPENWILPGLRDDKSPFFVELESALNQNDITSETAREALLEYLEKLDRVANLEVIGIFPDELTQIVHVIARTRNKPHQYFYRKQEKSIWSVWEKVELDIEGDHILPVVWNNRLLLFWALFEEKQEKNEDGVSLSISSLENGGTIKSSKKPREYLEVRLSWSEYKNGTWNSTKASNDLLLVNYKSIGTRIYSRNQLFLSSLKNNGSLLIRVMAPIRSDIHTDWIINDELLGAFIFDNCHSSLDSISGTAYFDDLNPISIVKVPSTVLQSHFLNEETSGPLVVFKTGLYKPLLAGFSFNMNIFNKTPGKFQLLSNFQENKNNKPVHFFYNNGDNNYYAHSIDVFRPTISADDLEISTGTLAARKDMEPVIGNPLSPGIKLAASNVLTTNGFTKTHIADKIKFPGKTIFFKRRYRFQIFYHPYVCNYIKILNTEGIDGLYKEQVQKTNASPTFKSMYDPTANVAKPYPEEELDFSFSGIYSLYNWELFFHIPLLIATKLSQNQKFEEARKWFHYIFDPTNSSESADAGVKRFWITRPFKKEIEDGILSVEELLNDADNQADLNIQLKYWENNPFKPHGIARRRISAYMRTTLMKYIDNLIAWGDQLFSRDSIESINEATLLYIMAANLLGKKPENIPRRTRLQEQSFNTLQNSGLDHFGNAKVAIQSFISPTDLNGEDTSDENVLMPLFCTPKNHQLLAYWDTVADRLFKIRHCMNIQGMVRQLPLFEPPIDPALLVRATAQGIDLTNVLNDVEVPLPHYRFQVMIQKANELAYDVKTLGSQLLSALEKRDAEELALLRSGQEIKLLDLIRDVRIRQRNEAKENVKALQVARRQVEEKYNYFNDKEYLNESESLYFDLTQSSIAIQSTLHLNYALASLRHLIPDVKIGSGFTLGTTYGGINLGNAAMTALEGGQALASFLKSSGELANMIGGFERRQEEWDFQANQAGLELKQMDQQLLASEIRLAIAEKELENHDQQIKNIKETDAFMREKFTNKELYDWMIDQISSVYFTSYQLAHNFAKKAEKCYRFELGNDDSFVSYGYWDSLKKGLQCADHLINDLNRMETSYLDKNDREYELIKHVSLSKLDPLALVMLKETGTCSFEIPEVLYDLDHAGHYFRRIKSVSVSLPCIVGPYTSVSAQLTLESNKYRNDPSVGPGYAEDLNDITNPDPRFTRNIGKLKSISTSTGQNDSGVFELNFRDERYLPFEGCGAISSWKLELPNEVRQFDYNTMTDVILHLKYTAKESSELKTPAVNSLKDQLNQIKLQLDKTGLYLALNLKYDLSNEWHLLKQNGTVNLKIDGSRLPYMAQTTEAAIEEVLFIAGVKDNPSTFPIKIGNSPVELEKINEDIKLLQATRNDIQLDVSFEIAVEEMDLDKLERLILFVKYRF